MTRIGIFLYGLLSYGVFLGVFVYAIGFIGGFVTPTMLDGAPHRSLAAALAINSGLLAVFALQHSGMARPAFKRWWTRIVPPAAERSTYVLMSSLALVALFAFWEPIGGVVWQAGERDLVSAFGSKYTAYRKSTPMLIPRLSAQRRAAVISNDQAQG